MAAYERIERVKGTNDYLAADFADRRLVVEKLTALFESFGYVGVELPIVEHTDLYLRKSGADVIAKLYSFTDFGGRRLSLRPELTASAMRAYLDSGDPQPLPVRWHYCGPVFRYERPQRGRYRQFTQQGVELIGAASPRADAEVLTLASEGLRRLGLVHHRIVLGHVGIVVSLLDRLQLSDWSRSLLLAAVEDLGRPDRGVPYVQARLEELGVLGGDADQPLRDVLAGLDEAQARATVAALIKQLDISLAGSRQPDEIVDRLLRKLRGADQRADVERALHFIADLAQISGDPGTALRDAEALVRRAALDAAPLAELRTIVDLAATLGVSRLTIDFGLARGLAYYTGAVFEIYDDTLPGEPQICGGGRYDGLARALGSRRDVPALGFAYGLERVVEAYRQVNQLADGAGVVPDALVAAASADQFAYAARVAAALRGRGWRVELDVRERTPRANLAYANRRGIRRVVIVDAADAAAQRYVLREMTTGEEQHVALSLA